MWDQRLQYEHLRSCRLGSHPNAELHTSAELKPTVVGLNQTSYGSLPYVLRAQLRVDGDMKDLWQS